MKNIYINEDRCKSCELCIQACPKKIIKLSETKMNSKGYRPAEIIDKTICSGCACCAIVCPDCAITIEKDTDKETHE